MSIKDKFPFTLPDAGKAPSASPVVLPISSARSGDKLAPAPVYLLAEHLDSVLAAGEDLAKARIIWDMSGRDGVADALQHRVDVRSEIETIRTLENVIIARVLTSRQRVLEVMRSDKLFEALGKLYVAGTAVLVDVAEECGDCTNLDFDTADGIPAYLRSRGLVAEDAPAPSDGDTLEVTEKFLIAKRIAIGPLMDLAATFLDSLETHYDLFLDEDELPMPPLVDRDAATAAEKTPTHDHGLGTISDRDTGSDDSTALFASQLADVREALNAPQSATGLGEADDAATDGAATEDEAEHVDREAAAESDLDTISEDETAETGGGDALELAPDVTTDEDEDADAYGFEDETADVEDLALESDDEAIDEPQELTAAEVASGEDDGDECDLASSTASDGSAETLGSDDSGYDAADVAADGDITCNFGAEATTAGGGSLAVTGEDEVDTETDGPAKATVLSFADKSADMTPPEEPEADDNQVSTDFADESDETSDGDGLIIATEASPSEPEPHPENANAKEQGDESLDDDVAAASGGGEDLEQLAEDGIEDEQILDAGGPGHAGEADNDDGGGKPPSGPSRSLMRRLRLVKS